MALTEPREVRLPPHHATSHSGSRLRMTPEESSHLSGDMKTSSSKGANSNKLQEVRDNVGDCYSPSTQLTGGKERMYA